MQRAAAMHFASSPNKPELPDVFEMKVHFLRPTLAHEIIIQVEVIFSSKQTSTVEVRLFQDGKITIVGLVM